MHFKCFVYRFFGLFCKKDDLKSIAEEIREQDTVNLNFLAAGMINETN